MISSLVAFNSLLESHLIKQVVRAHYAWIKHVVVPEVASAHCLEGLQGE